MRPSDPVPDADKSRRADVAGEYSSRAERLARHVTIYDRIIPVEEISQRIDAVSADDIGRIAGWLLLSEPTVTAMGPVDGLIDYETVKARLAG